MRAFKSLAFAAFALLLAACGPQTYDLRGTPKAAGADGELKIERTEAGNSLMSLEVKHLAPADRIEAGSKLYLAWLLTEDKPAIKVGKLAYDKKDREGKMVATTMEKAFIFRVTAEESVEVDKPSGAVIFEQTVEVK